MVTIKTVACPKCDGKGYLNGLGHYANGICFGCHGQKTVTINVSKMRDKLSDDTKKKAEWIMASTESSYAKLSYDKLKAIRDFVHSGNGLQEAYPDLYSHYFAVGNWAFNAAQTAKLDAYRASAH